MDHRGINIAPFLVHSMRELRDIQGILRQIGSLSRAAGIFAADSPDECHKACHMASLAEDLADAAFDRLDDLIATQRFIHKKAGAMTPAQKACESTTAANGGRREL